MTDLTVVTRLTLPNVDTRQGSCALIGQLIPNLHSLQLLGCVPSIRDLGTHFRNLTTLTLSRVQLVDLDGIHAFPALRELVVSHNLINDLAPLAFVDSLRVLDLAYNRVENWDQVLELVALDGLRTLNLIGNPIAVAGFEIKLLATLPTLRTLNESAVSVLRRPSSCDHPVTTTRTFGGIDSGAAVSTPVSPADQGHSRSTPSEYGEDVEAKLVALLGSKLSSSGGGHVTPNATAEMVAPALPSPSRRPSFTYVPLPSPEIPARTRQPSRSLSLRRNPNVTRLPPLAVALPSVPPLDPSAPPNQPIVLAAASPSKGRCECDTPDSPSAPPEAAFLENDYNEAPVRPSQARPSPVSATGVARFRRLNAAAFPCGNRSTELSSDGATARRRDSS